MPATSPTTGSETRGLAKAYLRLAREIERLDEEQARARIAASAELTAYADLLLDWPADAERWSWLASAPEAELTAWCERRKWNYLEDRERYPDDRATE